MLPLVNCDDESDAAVEDVELNGEVVVAVALKALELVEDLIVDEGVDKDGDVEVEGVEEINIGLKVDDLVDLTLEVLVVVVVVVGEVGKKAVLVDVKIGVELDNVKVDVIFSVEVLVIDVVEEVLVDDIVLLLGNKTVEDMSSSCCTEESSVDSSNSVDVIKLVGFFVEVGVVEIIVVEVVKVEDEKVEDELCITVLIVGKLEVDVVLDEINLVLVSGVLVVEVK